MQSLFILVVEQVTGGYLNYTVKVGPLKIMDKSYKLCDLLPAVNKSCPLAPGNDGQLSVTEAIPSVALDVRYTNLVK